MRGDISAPVALVYGFLLVFARVGGSFIFIPLPGVKNAAAPVRVVLVLAITMALCPFWPTITSEPSPLIYLEWVLTEAAFGIGIGLLVGVMSESLILFGQISGLQAGYSFASTIDPNTQADSTVLITMAETLGSLMFMSLGLHRQVIRIFASSLSLHPPGKLIMSPRWSETVIHAVAILFSTGLRLALPVIALLMMVDVTLAMLGRINSHLQLHHLSLPLKMLAGLAILTILMTLMPPLYESIARQTLGTAATFAQK
jgi:flagellar biosynthesis protein FliR